MTKESERTVNGQFNAARLAYLTLRWTKTNILLSSEFCFECNMRRIFWHKFRNYILCVETSRLVTHCAGLFQDFHTKKLLAMKRAVCSLNFNVITHLSHLENLLYSTWCLIDSCGIRQRTSIPKAKSVNQSFHTTAECAFLYANTRAKRLRMRKVFFFKLAVANANFTTRMPGFELKSNFINIQNFKAGNVKPPGMHWSKDF